MRATYEDLLRTARRIAVSAQRGIYPSESEVMADWEAVVAATANHLRWLRGRLRTEPKTSEATRRSDNSLGRLAQAIGAGADLLAAQDAAAAAALDVREDVIAARAEVAAIALMGARVVVRNTRVRTSRRYHVRHVTAELAAIADADVRRAGLGGLAFLAAGGPAARGNDLMMIAPLAVRWERAHAAMPPETVLTRDLRSTTAQLRTVGGQAWHIAAHLLTAPSAGLDGGHRLDLKILMDELRSFGSSTSRVDKALRRRLSDLNGPSDSPGEAAFLELKAAIDGVLRDDQGLRAPGDLIAHHRAAVELMDAVDELLWAAEQIARHQRHTLDRMVAGGRIFVPRHEAAQVDLHYLRRPGGGARLLQPRWVRTELAGCFDELTGDLAASADHLKAAADAARRLAGTSAQSRRPADPQTRIPAPYFELLDASGIADQGQEFADLGR